MEGTTAERATLLITASSASVAFGLAFNLGAFNRIFFDQLLTVWVLATIVLVGSLFSKLPPQNWAGRTLLLLPTGWILAAWWAGPTAEDNTGNLVFGVTIAITLIALPVIVWILVSVINPDFTHLPMSNRITIIVAVLFFVAAGYAMGARNDLFLNCDDFKVSGNDLPANCVQVDNASGSGG